MAYSATFSTAPRKAAAAAIAMGAVILSACSTVEMPNLDFMNLADFRNEIDSLDDNYPSPADTPALPTEKRTDAQWDEAAQELLVLSDEFDRPDVDPALSEEEFDAEFERLKAQGSAYRADDPS